MLFIILTGGISFVAFNTIFGIMRNFAAVAEVDNQGKVVSGGW